MICLLKTDTTVEFVECYYYLYSTMKNLLILLFLPLFGLGMSIMICKPLPCEPQLSLTTEKRYKK